MCAPACLITYDAKQIEALLKCADKYSRDEQVKIHCGFTDCDQCSETSVLTLTLKEGRRYESQKRKKKHFLKGAE